MLGHGVRFGVVTDVMAAGEGIETMLSVRSALPDLSMVAALSANHLAALLFRATLRRLYVVRDDDPAGDFAVTTLTERAQAAGIKALTLSPTLGDFNEDLRRLGIDIFAQLARAACPGGRGPISKLDLTSPGQHDDCEPRSRNRSYRHAVIAPMSEGRAPGLPEGDRTASGPVLQRRAAAIFRPPAEAGAFIAKQNSRGPPSSAVLRPLSLRSRCRSGPPAVW